MTDKHLVVLIEGQLAGRLTQAGGKLSFAYDDGYRSSVDPTPVSLSIPLAQRQHVGSRLDSYLWGLLPDNERVLERWAAKFDTTPGSVFGLLSGTGEDCAGAVQFVRPERADGILAGEEHSVVVDDAWIAGRIRSIRTDSAAWLPAEENVEGCQRRMARLRSTRTQPRDLDHDHRWATTRDTPDPANPDHHPPRGHREPRRHHAPQIPGQMAMGQPIRQDAPHSPSAPSPLRLTTRPGLTRPHERQAPTTEPARNPLQHAPKSAACSNPERHHPITPTALNQPSNRWIEAKEASEVRAT
jgi:HipA-like protein